jgi:hypothetical protein
VPLPIPPLMVLEAVTLVELLPPLFHCPSLINLLLLNFDGTKVDEKSRLVKNNQRTG